MLETSTTLPLFYRHVEQSIMQSFDGRALSESRAENYNLYDLGTSDPNNMKPKEFK